MKRKPIARLHLRSHPPETKMGDIPIWCHHHSSKIRVTGVSLLGKALILAGSAASLRIAYEPEIGRPEAPWKLTWEIRQSREAEVTGVAIFTTEDMRQAFELTDNRPDEENWLLERFGGSVASQGHYIRYGPFLNIPGPGTGHDGDPNISIKIDSEIKKAVRKLISGKL